MKGADADLVLSRCDTVAMTLHLVEISRSVDPGVHAVLMLDGAGRINPQDVIVSNNITLVTLPPCAPKPNPLEYIWQFHRDKWLGGDRTFGSYDDIVDRCCKAWNRLIDRPWKIMSIGPRNWTYPL